MAHSGRKEADTALLLALACGAMAEQAAQKAGVSVRTVRRRLATPEFRRRIQALRDDMVQRTTAMLTAASLEVVKTQLALLHSAMPPAVRLGATNSVHKWALKLREATELTERIAALEAEQRRARGE
jgi:uncharacterized small protein (DUF1192 family)